MVNAIIKVEVINDDFEYEDWGMKDLGDPQTYQFFTLAFGNGIMEEMRVVGETKGGVLIFANLIERGGSRRGRAADITNRKLYKVGDTCYPEGNPFIFISPNASNGETINLDNYKGEVESFIASLK